MWLWPFPHTHFLSLYVPVVSVGRFCSTHVFLPLGVDSILHCFMSSIKTSSLKLQGDMAKQSWITTRGSKTCSEQQQKPWSNRNTQARKWEPWKVLYPPEPFCWLVSGATVLEGNGCFPEPYQARKTGQQMTMSGLVNSKDDRCRLLGKEGNATTKIEMGFSDLGVWERKVDYKWSQ